MRGFFMNIIIDGNFKITNNEANNIKDITLNIFNIFDKLSLTFDRDIIIYFDSLASNPLFDWTWTNPNQIKIIIAMHDTNCWSQYIFQISHELLHSIIYSNNSDKTKCLYWFEEPICEMMSLYVLKEFCDIQYWLDISPYYCANVQTYLQDRLDVRGNNFMSNIQTFNDLKLLNDTAQDDRANHKNEVKFLYSMNLTKEQIYALISYKNFVIQNTILLDTISYRNEFSHIPQVKYLCDIQDRIK